MLSGTGRPRLVGSRGIAVGAAGIKFFWLITNHTPTFHLALALVLWRNPLKRSRAGRHAKGTETRLGEQAGVGGRRKSACRMIGIEAEVRGVSRAPPREGGVMLNDAPSTLVY